MGALKRLEEPFRFNTRLNLTELTGLKASTLHELLGLLRTVPGSSIYHHTHRFLQQHQYLSPEPPNDFAFWVTESLGAAELGERLASIDTVQVTTIRALRTKIVRTIETYVEGDSLARKRFAAPGEEFHFMKSVSFILATNYSAHDLREFADALQKVTIDSIYFHVFEARLRLERAANDFSLWMGSALGETGLARQIAHLDPYTCTMEGLRGTIVRLVESRIAEDDGADR